MDLESYEEEQPQPQARQSGGAMQIPLEAGDPLYLRKSLEIHKRNLPRPPHMPLDYIVDERPTEADIRAVERGVM